MILFIKRPKWLSKNLQDFLHSEDLLELITNDYHAKNDMMYASLPCIIIAGVSSKYSNFRKI